MKTKIVGNNSMVSLSAEQQWPAHLDALVAAPYHHKLLYENDRVRVLEVRIPRGERVPLHTHRWPAVLHLQSWSDHVRRDETGKIVFDSREAGGAPKVSTVVWCEPLTPHSVENVGGAELLVLSIELKDSESL
jgi:quercetin dioxygenase-like cupin family protein